MLHNLISKLFSKQREYSGTVATYNITIITIIINHPIIKGLYSGMVVNFNITLAIITITINKIMIVVITKILLIQSVYFDMVAIFKHHWSVSN